MERHLIAVLNQGPNQSHVAPEKETPENLSAFGGATASGFQSRFDIKPYEWRSLTWGGFELTNHPAEKEEIKKRSKDIYLKYNPTASKECMDPNQVPHAIADMYFQINKQIPRLIDIYYVLWRFDERQNGDITLKTFKEIIKCLAGIKSYWF